MLFICQHIYVSNYIFRCIAKYMVLLNIIYISKYICIWHSICYFLILLICQHMYVYDSGNGTSIYYSYVKIFMCLTKDMLLLNIIYLSRY